MSDISDEDDIDTINDVNDEYVVKKTDKQTIRKITKYEKTRILSERATQIANGSPIFIDGDYTDAYQIAEEEFNQNKIPFIIKRKNGMEIELWKLNEFD